jgi:uncharacterized iron-regulated membrane protein
MRVTGAGGIAEQALLNEEDAYYFGARDQAALPVYRVIANDAWQTRFYLDPVSGALLRRVDANARWHRWLFGALHRLDFAAVLRARPAWDLVMIALLLGGIGVSATGVYLAFRRIRRDLGAMPNSRRHFSPSPFRPTLAGKGSDGARSIPDAAIRV